MIIFSQYVWKSLRHQGEIMYNAPLLHAIYHPSVLKLLLYMQK
jgi:hypothetical protein